MRTIGVVAICVVLAAVYISPDGLLGLVLDAALREPDRQTALSKPHDPVITVDQPVTTPWETVADVIADAGQVEVSNAGLSQDGAATVLTLDLSQGLTAEVFTLANPYRVVIDMPEVAFALPDGTGQNGQGLVRAFRYGLFSEQQGRVVIDTTGPVRIDGARMIATDSGMDFEVRLVEISNTEFGDGTGANRAAPKPAPTPDRSIEKNQPVDTSPTRSGKPVVVIDPGHGGIDPGAVGVSNLLEKDIVLKVGLALREELQGSGEFDVRMTRSRDVFLALDRRVALSQAYDADLFVSLHADSVADTQAAASVRGASVYTLSDRASDEQARMMAEKENASDLLAGIANEEDQSGSDVRSILIDLIQRETANFSTEFSNVLLGQLRRDISLSRGPKRSAAFRVLKQTHAPSVLIELGYMSNAGDVELMRTKAWRQRVSSSISKAVKRYFRIRQARR